MRSTTRRTRVTERPRRGTEPPARAPTRATELLRTPTPLPALTTCPTLRSELTLARALTSRQGGEARLARRPGGARLHRRLPWLEEGARLLPSPGVARQAGASPLPRDLRGEARGQGDRAREEASPRLSLPGGEGRAAGQAGQAGHRGRAGQRGGGAGLRGASPTASLASADHMATTVQQAHSL